MQLVIACNRLEPLGVIRAGDAGPVQQLEIELRRVLGEKRRSESSSFFEASICSDVANGLDAARLLTSDISTIDAPAGPGMMVKAPFACSGSDAGRVRGQVPFGRFICHRLLLRLWYPLSRKR